MLADLVSVSLDYRPPFDWKAMLAYLRARATPGVEAVDQEGGRYWRSIQINWYQGFIAVGPTVEPDHTLRLDVSAGLVPALAPLQARLRRAFDLDANPELVAAHLRTDSGLAPLVARRPGLRVPGAADRFELALRAVLGQQVTVRGASTLAGRLARLVSEALPEPVAENGGVSLTHFPVTAERLADVNPKSLAAIGLPGSRVTCILALARAAVSGQLPELTCAEPDGDPTAFMHRLVALPGIGAWTAEYVAMRGLHWKDAFPASDLGLRKAMGGLSPARLRAAAERWRPWRAYAAQHLWASLGDSSLNRPLD